MDEAAGFEPFKGFADGLVAVAGGDPKLLGRQDTAGKEQSQKDAGRRPFQTVQEVILIFEGD